MGTIMTKEDTFICPNGKSDILLHAGLTDHKYQGLVGASVTLACMKARKGIIKKFITKNGNSQNILDNSFRKKTGKIYGKRKN